MLAGWLKWCWPVIVPLPLLWGAQARLIDHLGRDAGATLARVARVLLPARALEEPVTLLSPLVEPAAPHVVSAAPAARTPKAEHRSGKASAQQRRAIRITEQTVLRLANAGVQPRGSFVPAAGSRPPGLLLTGVTALGIGLRDGDVLVSAGGQPATSPGSVIGLVVSARGARARELRGQIWREGGALIELIVEQPYLEEPPSESRESSEIAPNSPQPGGPA